MSNTAGPATPLSFITSRKTAGDQISGTTPGVYTVLIFETDDFQFLNGIIDRPTNTQFRALIAGFYRMSYSLLQRPSNPNRGWRSDVILNGATPVLALRTNKTSGETATPDEVSSANSKIIQLAANDVLTVGVDPRDGGSIATLDHSAITFELVRPV